MDRFIDTVRCNNFPGPGYSFMELFKIYTQEYSDRIVIHPGYLDDGSGHSDGPLTWGCGEAVEVLVYDMGPTPFLLNAIWDQFSPFFLKNRTLVVFNEYGKLSSSAIWQFCRQRSAHLRPFQAPHIRQDVFIRLIQHHRREGDLLCVFLL